LALGPGRMKVVSTEIFERWGTSDESKRLRS